MIPGDGGCWRKSRSSRRSSSDASRPTTIGGSGGFRRRPGGDSGLAVWIYRRDSEELPWYLRIGLPLLRTLVLIGLLVVYLQPQWRSERQEHLDSRVLMLVDTSLSMARLDPDTPGGRAGQTRLQQVAAGLDDSKFLDRLRKKHNVTVVPFNSVLEKDRRVVLPMQTRPPAKGTAGRRPAGRGGRRVAAIPARSPLTSALSRARRPIGASSLCPAAPIPAWARPWSNSCATSGARRFPGSCW